MFNFKFPYVLLLIPIIIYLFFRKHSQNSITVPGLQNIKKYAKHSKKYLFGKLFILISTILMVIALARPQSINKNRMIKKEGIDIVIALDLSKSMEAKDFIPNRLEKSKELLRQFIQKRLDDRLSLVVFGGEAYTKVPLTFDNNVLDNVISTITTNDITSNNRTAIGMGLAVAVNRLKNSQAKSKVIILMTDGENNSGEMSPIGAAEIAKSLGIKVYTIGIGAKEIPISSFFGKTYVKNTELDENLLKKIATMTDGKYFRADDNNKFKEIFNDINKLEKTKIKNSDSYDVTEYFEIFLKISLISLLIGVFFEYLKYIRIP